MGFRTGRRSSYCERLKCVSRWRSRLLAAELPRHTAAGRGPAARRRRHQRQLSQRLPAALPHRAGRVAGPALGADAVETAEHGDVAALAGSPQGLQIAVRVAAVGVDGREVGQGLRVGLCDCDLYGPSVAHMFGSNERPNATADNEIIPIEIEGLKMISMGFLLEDRSPVIVRGPMATRNGFATGEFGFVPNSVESDQTLSLNQGNYVSDPGCRRCSNISNFARLFFGRQSTQRNN